MRACIWSYFSCVQLFATLWTVACQVPLSMGFSRQEYWSGLPFPPPGDLPDPGINPSSTVLVGKFFTNSKIKVVHWEAVDFKPQHTPVGFAWTSRFNPSLLFNLQVVSDSLPPQDCGTPGFPVLYYLLEFVQIHVSWVTDAISISSSVSLFSCPQSSPASWSFPVSQLFLSDSQSICASASFLPMNIQGWFPLGLTGMISLWSNGLSRVFPNTTIWKHQFFSAQPSLWSNAHIWTWLLEKLLLWLYETSLAKWCLCFLLCSLVWS